MSNSIKITINITDAERRQHGVGDPFIAYCVHTVRNGGEGRTTSDAEDAGPVGEGHTLAFPEDEYYVWRRYTDFEALFHYLMHKYPYLIIPPLPPKREMYDIKRYLENLETSFVEARRVQLLVFMVRLASHAVIVEDQLLHHFLQDERPPEYEEKSQTYLDSLLKAATNTGSRLMKRVCVVDRRIEAMENFASHLDTSCSGVVKAYKDLDAKEDGFETFKGRCGQLYEEWGQLEDWGDLLDTTGHFMRQPHAPPHLGDQHLFARVMLEYARFAEQIRRVTGVYVDKRTKMATLEDSLREVEELIKMETGAAPESVLKGLQNKLFRQLTDSEKGQKMIDLQLRKTAVMNALLEATTDLDEFMSLVEVEYEQFKAHRLQDFKEAMRHVCQSHIAAMTVQLESWKTLRAVYRES